MMSSAVSINFDKIKSFLAEQSSIGIEVDATGDADVLKALKEDQPFPDRDVELGKITVGTSDGKNIEFETGTGNAVFPGKAGASVFTGLGVYHKPQKLLSGLPLGEKINPSIKQVDGEESLFMLLNWGYDIGGSANGTVALANAAKVTFGSEGRREALFAVIRRIPKSGGARSAIKQTVDNWILPSRVDGADDLDPGTWLITEVESAIDFKLGAQYGYDFDWVKEAKLGGLKGDIGLRLQLGVDVALGFHISGKFALVLARESGDPDDKQLRLQLFRLRKKGWDFALDAKASVDGDIDQLSESFDVFIKAVFAVHGEQVIKDLKAIEQWTDPEQELPELLGGVGVDYLKEFVEKVTGLNPENSFNEAKEKLLGFLTKWDELDHEVATRLWKLAEENVVHLDAIRKTLDKITGLDQDKAREYIEEILADVHFYRTPVGKFLIDLLPPESLLTTLTDSQAFGKLQEKAENVSELLDGGPLQDLFTNLQDEINGRLNLDKVKDEITEAEFEDLDGWLKAKLADFLGEENLIFSKLEDIRKTIDLLLEKREALYSKTLKALNKKYEFSLNAAYQRSESNQALMDLVFDFSKGDVGDLLKDALNGNFDHIFVEKHEGVKINTATLTHEIERQSTVEVSLPFYNSTVTHINKSLARVDAVDEDEGRILIYELGAKDIVTRKNKRMSSLSIGGYFKTGANRVHVFTDRSLSYSYSFRQFHRKMKRVDLEYQLEPYIDSYFAALFNNPGEGLQAEPFSTWIGDLDETIDRLEFNGKDNFGPTFISLDVSLPSDVAAAWLKAPSDENAAQYMDMSRNLQAALKQLIPYYYFQDINHFKNRIPSLVLLAYASIPPCTTIKVSRNRITEINTNKDIYWDWPDKDLQAGMLFRGETTGEFARNLYRVYNRLKSSPGMDETAKRYNPQNLESILSELASGITSSGARVIEMLFYSLFYTEKEIIKGARKAGLELAEFMSQSDSKPSEAVKSLAGFGESITETFNKKIKSNYGGDALRPLGALMFVEAARAFDPGVVSTGTRALLDITVLKKSAEEEYLEKADIPEDFILLEERLIS